MNRQTEYETMLNEIPPADLTPILAKARTKRRAVVGVRNSLMGLVSVFVAFVFLVNMFPTVAYAMGRIPILKDLAKAVAFSPSLSAAVENEYVQPMNIVMEDGGITMKIEYIIVDQTQVNIFYTITGGEYSRYNVETDYRTLEGEEFTAYSNDSPGYVEEGDIGLEKFELFEGEVPGGLLFAAKIRGADPDYAQAPTAGDPMIDSGIGETVDYVAEFETVLEFDPEFTEQGEIHMLNKSFDLDGQTIIVDSLEIFPTNARLVIKEDEENELALSGLDFYIRNEKGEVFDNSRSGLISTGVENGMAYIFDTSFFSESEEFELVVEAARWLDKSIDDVHFNLVNETAEFLPMGAEWVDTIVSDWGTTLKFKVNRHDDFNLHIWYWSYKDAQGTEHYSGGYSTADPEPPEEGYLYESYMFEGFHGDEIWLKPTHTSISTYDTPITVKL